MRDSSSLFICEGLKTLTFFAWLQFQLHIPGNISVFVSLSFRQKLMSNLEAKNTKKKKKKEKKKKSFNHLKNNAISRL